MLLVAPGQHGSAVALHAAAAAARRSSPALPIHSAASQIRDIGSGNFGVAKLCRARDTGELVAVKYIERGEKVGTGAWFGLVCWPARCLRLQQAHG